MDKIVIAFDDIVSEAKSRKLITKIVRTFSLGNKNYCPVRIIQRSSIIYLLISKVYCLENRKYRIGAEIHLLHHKIRENARFQIHMMPPGRSSEAIVLAEKNIYLNFPLLDFCFPYQEVVELNFN